MSSHYRLEFGKTRGHGACQESRKFGRVIAERAKSGAPELSSGVVSYMRLFSSDGILRAERLAGERHCVSSDSR
jgi:hypothetical protein